MSLTSYVIVKLTVIASLRLLINNERYKPFGVICFLCFFYCFLSGQEVKEYWTLEDDHTVILDCTQEDFEGYSGNIEMSGKRMSAIVYYEIDENGQLEITKDLIFPQLRTFNKTNEPDWKKYRAYFRRDVDESSYSNISVGTKTFGPGRVERTEINGKLIFHHEASEGIQLRRILYPSMEQGLFIEEWHLTNISSNPIHLTFSETSHYETEVGYKGEYYFESGNNTGEYELFPTESAVIYHWSRAGISPTNQEEIDFESIRSERDSFLHEMGDRLILTTPNDRLNSMFHFAKIRASESIFESSLGYIHSPGGGNYYVGIWANDQVEYCGPFFPYLGYKLANQAAYNAYLHFSKNIPEEGHIPYAFEVDGNFPMTHLDRGDAAMIAYGTSKYLLSLGDKEKVKELWPLITWCLEYCHNMLNEEGVVKSESDEMEGRIPTGDANLSTSSLYYGGLKFAGRIAKEMDQIELYDLYENRRKRLEQDIEAYFGRTIDGYETYQYFDGNPYLRHWICLPLTMGIFDRKQGTIEALFKSLWTENGILVEYNPNQSKEPVFWDRATLYALRGAFQAGAANQAIQKLEAYTTKRLLGDHVPYAIEAYPENNKKHLSAESALYCRIFTEGILGLEPANLNSFYIQPNLPDHWDMVKLENLYLQGSKRNIEIRNRYEHGYEIFVEDESGVKKNFKMKRGERTLIQD